MGRIGEDAKRAADDKKISELQKARVAKAQALKATDAYGKRAGSGIKRRE